jgi:hypothetical protein
MHIGTRSTEAIAQPIHRGRGISAFVIVARTLLPHLPLKLQGTLDRSLKRLRHTLKKEDVTLRFANVAVVHGSKYAFKQLRDSEDF